MSVVAKKKRRVVPVGVVHIEATFNNTLVTVTDLQGDTIVQSSSGKNGFKGSKKSTPYAAQVAVEDAVAEWVAVVGLVLTGIDIDCNAHDELLQLL